MGTGARPLATDEISIGCRDRALAGGYRFAVGGQAHRASGLAPFETCVGEKLVEPLGNSIALDHLRTRHDPSPYTGRNLAAACDLRGGTQIAQPAIGTCPDEDPIKGRADDRRPVL